MALHALAQASHLAPWVASSQFFSCIDTFWGICPYMDWNDFTRLGSLCVTLIHKMGYVIPQIQQNQILSPLVFSSLLSRVWCAQYHTAPWHTALRGSAWDILIWRGKVHHWALQEHGNLTSLLLHAGSCTVWVLGLQLRQRNQKQLQGFSTQSLPVLFPFLFNCRMHSCSVRKQDVNPSTCAEEWVWFSNKHFNIQIFATTT